MPLTTRTVSPVNLSQNRLNPSVQRDELQCVANGTLANLIRQLGSLNRHAEQLFSDVHREVLKIDYKTNSLFLRVERLTQKVLQSDANKVELASLEENHMRKAFKSTNIIDQHTLDRQTLPNTLQDLYTKCDPPPELNQLNPYRDNPKDALELYTNPGYFFDLWKEEMLKDLGRVGRSTRSPGAGAGASKSPSRGRRRQRTSTNANYSHQQPNPIQQTNVLIGHYGAAIGTHTNAPVANGRHHAQAHMNDQNNAQQLHFPAEYQAPQHMIQSSGGRIQPPPGMSLHAEAKPGFMQQQNYSGLLQQQLNERPFNAVLPQQQQQQQQKYSVTDSNNEDIDKKFKDMTLNSNVVSGVITSTATNFGGFLENDDDDDLPPPPPVLSTHTMMGTGNSMGNAFPSSSSDFPTVYNGASSSSNQAISDTMQFVPSGGNMASSSLQQNSAKDLPSSVPPPPPPPPPPMPSMIQLNVSRKTGGGGSFATNTKISERENSVQNSSETNGQSVGGTENGERTETNNGNQISNLLMEIQSGIKLKKVQRQEELAEVRAAHTSNDVAAILKRRMEHMMGNDDSSESNGSDTNSDWDD